MSVENISPHYSFMLHAARAIAAHRELQAEHIRLARHMAHDGKSTAEILAALGLGWTYQRFHRHLLKLNIHARNISDRCHRGEETTLPTCDRGLNVDMLPYRPKRVTR